MHRQSASPIPQQRSLPNFPPQSRNSDPYRTSPLDPVRLDPCAIIASMRTATKRKKRLSCGVVVVHRSGDDSRFLLLRAFHNWDFPKGIRERGETPLAAALREVAEETTIDDLVFRWGEEYVETGPYSRGKTARYYIAETQRQDVDLPVNPALGRAEHSEFRWVDLAEARVMTTARLDPVLDWVARVLRI